MLKYKSYCKQRKRRYKENYLLTLHVYFTCCLGMITLPAASVCLLYLLLLLLLHVLLCVLVCVWWFQVKNLVVCAYLPTTPADCNLFNNHRNKSMVGGNYNVSAFYKNASAPGPEGVVLCNTFKWDILLCVHHIHFKSLKCVLCVSLHYEIPQGLQS